MIIISLIIIAVIVQVWRDCEDRKNAHPETAQTEEAAAGENFLLEIIDESKAHIVILSCLTAAEWAVKVKQAHKLEERGRKL